MIDRITGRAFRRIGNFTEVPDLAPDPEVDPVAQVPLAEALARKIPGTHGGAFVALDVLRAAAREAGYHPRRPDLRRYGVLEGCV